MFEKFIAPVINKVLGDYVGNLESKQLSIGIWQGDVALHNLRLRKDALDKFNLPIEVLEGYLGDLTLSIPWNDLKNKPVKIFINNVYVLARPKAAGDYDPIEEDERMQKAKQERLETAEMILNRKKEPHIEGKQNDSTFMTQLVTKIVDNLQITMKNIHIRYEDSLSNPSNPFSVGITLEELSAVSCDQNWQPAFIHEQTELIRKLSRLGSLALYFNTHSESFSGKSPEEFMKIFHESIATGERIPINQQYILKPVSGTARLKTYKKQPVDDARHTAWLEFDELGFVLDRAQFTNSISLLGAFSSYLRSHKYRKFRPPRTITPVMDPKAWLKFAANSVLSDIHEKNRRWTWGYFEERRKDRLLYIQLYKHQKEGTLSLEDRVLLSDLERKLSFEDILLYRSVALSQMRKSAPTSPTKPVEKEIPKSTTWNTLSNWWGGTSKTEASKSGDNFLTDDQMKQLYDTIEFNPDAPTAAVELPQDAVLVSLRSHLKSGSLALKDAPSGADTSLMSLIFQDFRANVTQYVASVMGNITLGNMVLNDSTTPGTLYPTLIQAKNRKEDLGDKELQGPFFKMQVEHNPLDGRADDAVSIVMLPLQVVYNPVAINTLVAFFTPPPSEFDMVSTIQAVAQDTFEGLTAQTRAGLAYALEEHKTLDLKVDFAAPIFVLPQSCTDSHSMMMLVDAGHFLLESNYVNKEKKKELQLKHGALHSAEDLGELTTLLYDRFTCQLSSVQVLIGQSLDRCLEEALSESLKGEFHLIERVNMSFVLEMCILPKLVDFARMKISGNLPRLHLNLSDRKYKVMMSIVDLITNRSQPIEDGHSQQRTEPASGARPLRWSLGENEPEAVVYDDGDSFYDAPEEMDVDTRSEMTDDSRDRVLVDLRFDVNHASVSLMKSEKDPHLPDRPLADLTIDTFGLNVRSLTHELDVKVRIRAVVIDDKLQSEESEFRYLLAPTVSDDAESITSDKSSVDQLIRVRYLSMKPTCADYKGIDQSLDVSFAAVTVVLTSSSVLMLYDFILSTFTSPNENSSQHQQLQDHTGDASDEDAAIVSSKTTSLLVNANMKSIAFVINQDGHRLATARFGELQTSVLMKNNVLSVTGGIGDLAVVDDVQRVGDGRLFRQLLEIEGEELAHFKWETFDKMSPQYPGYDTALTLRASSIRITYLESLLHELMEYFSKFRDMHVLLESARKAAIESAQHIQEAAGRFHYDVEIQSPILEFPKTSLQSMDTLTIFPGIISAKNVFETEFDGTDVDKVTATVHNMKVATSFSKGADVEERQILDNVTVNVIMKTTNSSDSRNIPDSTLDVTVSDVRIKTTQRQYSFLLELGESLARLASSEVTELPEESQLAIDEPKFTPLTVEHPNNPPAARDIKVTIPSICLEIFKIDRDEMDTSLAQFAMNKVIFKFSASKEGSSEAELQVRTFSIRDTRQENRNFFREIMPSTGRDEDQLVVHYSSSEAGSNTIATLTSPTVILIPDHVFLVRDFFVKPLASKPSEASIRKQFTELQDTELNNETTSSYRVDLIDMEVILLHTADVPSTEAIILSSKHLAVCHEHVTTVGIKEMGMYLCEMDKRDETTVPFIQDFDLTLSMDNRMTAPGHSLSNINVDLAPVMLRVSYRDILLITEIVTGVNTHWAASNAEGSAASDTSTEETQVVSAQEKVIMVRERLHATVQGFRLVLIDDLNDLHLPMLDVIMDKLVIDLADWTSTMRLETAPSLSCNYFNVKNSHWEPFIEPWQFFINSATGTLSLDAFARKRLEINVTHTFVETVLSTMHLWNKQERRDLTSRRGMHSPYVFRNRTGYDLYVWADSADSGLDTELKQLANGQDMPWRFEDWRTMRERTVPISNKVSLQLNGPSWETLKGISLDREGMRTYILRPAINRVVHRLVCEVKLKDNVKIVTFRSGLELQNDTSVTVDMVVVNSKKQRTTNVTTIVPGEEFYVPIEASYYDMVQVRPHGFGYDWSTEIIFWKDLQKQNVSLITCRSTDPTAPAFRFQLNCVYTHGTKDSTYPMMTVKLLPPFQLENLLPYDMRYSLHDKTARQQHTEVLRKGDLQPIHTVDPTHLLALGVEIPNSAYRPSEVAIITNSELDYRDETLRLADPSGQQLLLRIKYQDKLDMRGRTVSIYSPYVLLNKTGVDMIFSTRSLMGVTRYTSPGANEKEEVKPVLFSFPNFEPLRSRVQVKVLPNSDWSKPISFDAVGSSFEISIPSSKTRTETHIGATIREGEGKYFLTKVVTFAPRFIFKNNMDEDIQFRQFGATTTSHLRSHDQIPLHTLNMTEGPQTQMCIRLTGLMNEWSNPFDVTQVGRVYVKLGRMSSPEQDLVRTEVLIQDATIFVIFAGRETRWPYRIENRTDVDVDIWQQGSKTRYKIPKGEERPYAWDYPSAPKKALILSANGREREIDVLEMGQLVPFKYPATPSSKGGIMAIHVVAEGPTIVVRLSPYVESKSAFKKSRSRPESTSSEVDVKETFQMKKKEANMLMAVQVRLEGIGVSLINKGMQELLYASARNLTFAFTDTTMNQALTFSVKWLQIDNQLYEGLEPIFLYPSVIPKEGEEDYHPVLMTALSRSKDPSYGVDFFDWFTILLQELSVDMDEEFLGALISFTKFNVPGWDEEKSTLCDTSMSIPEPPLTRDDNKMYFETFLLQPVQINVSFVRTQTVNIEETRPRHHGVLTFVLDVLTMTLGNIHDAPLRLNALELKHANVTLNQLVDLIVRFYSQELIGQVHKVIGSADFLGNPVGLFNNVSSGVSDFFYEPLQGFEITRPQDFGIGVAKGAASLFRKTVFGVSDTFSKFTGSIGKGLSVITMDSEFQQRRRLSSIRNRPRHAVYGVTTGATSLARSVASGLTGVVSKPFEGAQEEGVGGFFKGLGKGIVGVVTKPVIGVIDLATNVGEGIRNTTTVFDTDLDRQRLPRHIGKDKILTQPYNPREALGLNWLKGLESGRYFHEEYIAHLELRIEDLVAIVTNARIIMTRIKKLKMDWEIPFEELQLVRPESGGITLIKKSRQHARARVIPCPDASSAQWFCGMLESAFTDFIEQYKPYE
ncbi:hypothetical protein SpCBS45565_g02841 [Spizellomyces sp. 'palustris']|nr:hypothetical protein SpCBS45565_g02841 [Spizellomyces sp. 'palustris']